MPEEPPPPTTAVHEREERRREAESVASLGALAAAAQTGANAVNVRLAREDIVAIASAVAQALHEKFRSPNFQFDALYRLPFSQDSAAFVAGNMRSALKIPGKDNHLKYVLGRVGEGLILEFGVFKGHTVNLIADTFPEREVHGFDSFEGLPEDWPGYNVKASFFDQAGRMPKVRPNVRLHKGWFDQTLPEFLAAVQDTVAFVHVDCDLYSSTKTVLDLLAPRMRAGTVIAFDEYHNFPHWREHEHRAFEEFCLSHDVEFEYISFNNLQAAIKINRIGDLKQ